LALAGGTAVEPGADESNPGAVGGKLPVEGLLGGRVLGGNPAAGVGFGLAWGNGGKSPCCALTRSDVVEIATMTPAGTIAGIVAAIDGQEAA
jgi:hypothetical protein